MNCPILKDTEIIRAQGVQLIKSMRKLSRDLKHCQKCPKYEDCETLKSFNLVVREVLVDIGEEWDRTHER